MPVGIQCVSSPADIATETGGWTTDGMGQGYGNGFEIAIHTVG